MSRVLVTGGAGFVGSHVCDELSLLDHEIVVLDDLSRGNEAWLPHGAELRRADIRNRDAVLDAFRDVRPQIVVHLAALHFIPAVDEAPRVAEEINVDGTANVVAACYDVRPDVLVFASTAAVYPNLAEPISEQTSLAPLDLYGRTKAAGERLVADLAARTAIRCVAARLFNAVGPRETNPHVIPEIIAQLRGGAHELSLGSLEPRRDYIDVRDVAAAIMMLALGAGEGFAAYNVGTGRGVSVREIVAACERVLVRTVPVRTDPARVRPVDRPSLVADVAAIREAFGWSAQRTFAETLAELLDAPVEAVA